MKYRFWNTLIGLVVLLLESGLVAATPGYLGSGGCAECHQSQHEAWSTSHHAHAMESATVTTVLGDFDDAEFEYAGRRSRFYRRGSEFWVLTEGPDGDDHDYKIEYTFGYHPLQQYLVHLGEGRYHALSIAWDSRAREAGGQRWFHLYPDEQIDAADPLHWTGPYQQWNSRCADCHSTAIERGFNASNASFNTQWAEINVGCESCHGPGAEHAQAAQQGRQLALPKQPGNAGSWAFTAASPIAERSGESTVEQQLGVCAPCHSRRTNFADIGPNQRFLDAHQPATLETGLYERDGQILDEVFVYGSFVQSRMYQRGVTCSDCHDPHSAQLKASGNAVCSTCHLAAYFDQPTHHRHTPGESGSACVDCHMPQRTYMVVDPRRDHSFRVPDPWLSKEQGTPNTCTDCHQDQTVDWAIAALREWGVKRRGGSPAALLARAHGGDATALRALRALAADTSAPPMQRSSALSMMMPGSEADLDLLAAALRDPHPLVRWGAVRALGTVSPEYARAMLWPMLQDEFRVVRLEAVRMVAGVPDSELSVAQRDQRAAVVAEYVAAQDASAGIAAGPMNLAALYVAQGNAVAAEQAYQSALKVEPALVPAWLNLADLQRATGREEAAGRSLEQALKIAPESAAAHHSYGLHRVRQGHTADALVSLKEAQRLDPASVRYAYVYAIALHSTGQLEAAIGVAEGVRKAGQADPNMLQLLVTFYQEQGNVEGVRSALDELRRLDAAMKQG